MSLIDFICCCCCVLMAGWWPEKGKTTFYKFLVLFWIKTWFHRTQVLKDCAWGREASITVQRGGAATPTKNKWKIRASGRGLRVAILVISKAKVRSKSTRPPGIADAVEDVMREMKARQVKRFHCQPGEFGAARAAVYRAREKIGVRFGTSKSKDGVLLIIRG